MQACREGGARMESALRALDAEVAVALHRECRSVVRDVGAADDLVQQTFVKVWHRCATYRGDGELLGWMRGILRHAIIDHFRAKKPEESLDDEDGEMTATVATQVAAISMASVSKPDDIAESTQREACYRTCFARFEADFPLHATVMRWIAEDDLSNREIEELLQRTPGATREFISQCRKKARVYFEDWYAMMRDVDVR